MKFFVQCLKNCVLGWGLAATVIAVFSVVAPDRVTMHLLRVVLINVTIVCVWSYFVFSIKKLEIGIWLRRMIVSISGAVIGIFFVIISGIRPFSIDFCIVYIIGCLAVSAAAYLIADKIEAGRLDAINEKLSGGK